MLHACSTDVARLGYKVKIWKEEKKAFGTEHNLYPPSKPNVHMVEKSSSSLVWVCGKPDGGHHDDQRCLCVASSIHKIISGALAQLFFGCLQLNLVNTKSAEKHSHHPTTLSLSSHQFQVTGQPVLLLRTSWGRLSDIWPMRGIIPVCTCVHAYGWNL